MTLKKKIFLVVSLLYILYTVVPIIPDITGIEVWLVNLSTFIILFSLYPRAFANPVMYWFLAYAAILAVYVVVGKPLTIGIGTVQDSKKVIIEYAFMLPSFSIFSVLYFLKDFKLFKYVAVGGLSFVVISFLYLVPILLVDGEILRVAHELISEQNKKTFGVPNYTLMHAYIIAVPALLYGIKVFDVIKKWVLIAVFFLFVYIILHTYVTTSLIITFGTIIFALIYDIKNKARSFLLIFLTGFVVYILHTAGVFIQLFDFLLRFFEGSAVEPKIEGFKYIYLGGDIESSGGHITGRMSYHDMSWKAFSENFLIGGASPVGGHSQIIDRLGGMGIIPFIPFVMIIVSLIRMTLYLIKGKEQRMFYFLGLLSVLILLYQKGLFDQEGWLFFVLLMPGLIVSFKNIKIEELIIKNKLLQNALSNMKLNNYSFSSKKGSQKKINNYND